MIDAPSLSARYPLDDDTAYNTQGRSHLLHHQNAQPHIISRVLHLAT